MAIWQDLGASPWVVKVLRYGLTLPFLIEGAPPLSIKPVRFSPSTSMLMRRELELEVLAMKTTRVIERPPLGTPGFYSNIFLVPKSEQRWRLIIDLSRLSVHIDSGFSHGNIRVNKNSNATRDWVISIDLTDTYLHIPIHKRYRRYLRFTHNQTIWQFKNMPFGLSVPPWLFTMVTTQVKIMAHRQVIIMHMYLDDWVIRSQCRLTLVKQTQWLLNLCMTIGLRVNFQKSELTPSQDFNCVGYRYMTNIRNVVPTEKIISNIKTMTSTFLEQDPNTAQQQKSWSPWGMRELQFCLKSQWSQACHSRWMRVPLSDFFRCVEGRMGSSSRNGDSVGKVERGGVHFTHNQSGIVGSVQITSTLGNQITKTV